MHGHSLANCRKKSAYVGKILVRAHATVPPEVDIDVPLSAPKTVSILPAVENVSRNVLPLVKSRIQPCSPLNSDDNFTQPSFFGVLEIEEVTVPEKSSAVVPPNVHLKVHSPRKDLLEDREVTESAVVIALPAQSMKRVTRQSASTADNDSASESGNIFSKDYLATSPVKSANYFPRVQSDPCLHSQVSELVRPLEIDKIVDSLPQSQHATKVKKKGRPMGSTKSKKLQE